MIRRWFCLVMAFAVTGCASMSERATQTSTTALAALQPATSSSDARTPAKPECLNTKSRRPTTPLPEPGQMPAGSTMQQIKSRGRLRAGVDEDTLLLSFRNPTTDKFEGFEIDLLREIAARIFPDNPDALELVPVSTDHKIDVVKNGTVDLTASAVTPTCARADQVLFSTPYFLTHQKVLVRKDDRGPIFPDGTRVDLRPLRAGEVDELAPLREALAGRKVCWTKGSTSIANIELRLTASKPYEVERRSDCLLALQDGVIDAVSTHETFLLGYELQDPSTMILPDEISEHPYSIAVNRDHGDLVEFVNAVILELEANGRLAEIYQKNFVDCEACRGLDDPTAKTLPAVEHVWSDG